MLDFLFVYEHKARELETICLLRAELERRGHTVDFIQVQEWRGRLKMRFFRRPKVIIPFSLYSDNSYRRNVGWFAGNCRKVINMQSEQIPVLDEKTMCFNTPKGIAAQAVHCCWSESFTQYLLEHGCKNAVLTGFVQLDWYLPRFRSATYLGHNENINVPKSKNSGLQLLFISSFAAAPLSDEETAHLKEQTGVDAFEWRRNERELRDSVLEIFAAFLKQNPSVTLIYRPHPAEHVDSALTCQGDHFKISRSGTIREWLDNVDGVLTCMSTSIVQLYYSGVKAAILRPVPLCADRDPEIFHHASFISSLEELQAWFEKPPASNSFPVPAEQISLSYANDGVTPVYREVCDLFEDVLASSKYDISGSFPGHVYGWGLVMPLIKVILNKITLLKQVGRHIPFVGKYIEAFYRQEIHNRLNQASDLEISETLTLARKMIGLL